MPSYLVQSRHSVWYFRVRTPFGEKRKSLGTRSKWVARMLAYERWSEYQTESKRQQSEYWDFEEQLEENGINEVDLLKARIADLEKQIAKPRPLDPQVPVVSQMPLIDGDDISLRDAIDRFIAAKENLRPQTIRKFDGILGVFRRILSENNRNRELMLSQLTPTMMRTYVDVVGRLPKRVGKRHRNLMKLAGTGTPIAVTTRNYHFSLVTEFLSWADLQQYAVPRRLDVFGKLRANQSKLERLPFTKPELTQIFGTDEYKHGKFDCPADYWMPLLGLLTTARAGELLQLRGEDIYKDDESGLWLIDFNEKHGKKLKNRNSIRRTPIHKTLRRLGFVQYAQSLKPDQRLFPESVTMFGDSVGYTKRFTRLLQTLGIHRNYTKTYHSFRHAGITWLRANKCPDDLRTMISGHTQKGADEGIRTYMHDELLPEKARWIDKMDFGIDFDLIKGNGWRQIP